ncbi:MAG: CDP-diacylglycerol--glycerol-3-phosphate 3-phosphatidyltransferase [Kiritimatiellae bacterium]|nr:CDP-diacylglycerol--glycerol-3-phosphate 3-phosphatidyltransferase [Kiritimatiellia bacterium]
MEKQSIHIPNILTLSRLILTLFILVLLSTDFFLSKTAALLIFIIAGMTDYYDGYLARNVYGVSPFGELMDPLTDKIMVCATFVSFVELQWVPAWMAVIIISREFLVTGLRLLALQLGKVISAGKWGKHKTVWQIVAISAILLGLAIRNDIYGNASIEFLANYDTFFRFIAYGISVSAVIITVVSGAMYLLEHKELLKKNMRRETL